MKDKKQLRPTEGKLEDPPITLAELTDLLDVGAKDVLQDGASLRAKRPPPSGSSPLPTFEQLQHEVLFAPKYRKNVQPGDFVLVECGGDGGDEGDGESNSRTEDDDDAHGDDPDTDLEDGNDGVDGHGHDDDEDAEELPARKSDLVSMCRDMGINADGSVRVLRARIHAAQEAASLARDAVDAAAYAEEESPQWYADSSSISKKAVRQRELVATVEFVLKSATTDNQSSLEKKVRSFSRLMNGWVPPQSRERSAGSSRNRFFEDGLRHNGATQQRDEADEDAKQQAADDEEEEGSAPVVDATPPDGFDLVDSCPATEYDVVDKYVLFKFDGAPTGAGMWETHYNGWYRGKVKAIAAVQHRRNAPGVTHEVTFNNKDTAQVIPACFGWLYRGQNASGVLFLGLTDSSWGKDKKWIVLQEQEQAASVAAAADRTQQTGAAAAANS
jgi:hypothetical protein